MSIFYNKYCVHVIAISVDKRYKKKKWRPTSLWIRQYSRIDWRRSREIDCKNIIHKFRIVLYEFTFRVCSEPVRIRYISNKIHMFPVYVLPWPKAFKQSSNFIFLWEVSTNMPLFWQVYFTLIEMGILFVWIFNLTLCVTTDQLCSDSSVF